MHLYLTKKHEAHTTTARSQQLSPATANLQGPDLQILKPNDHHHPIDQVCLTKLQGLKAPAFGLHSGSDDIPTLGCVSPNPQNLRT